MKRKLIEVALPLEAINRASKDDKDRKTGHIRNLHKWYAPMPLPAWRAALFASLIDDPSATVAEDAASTERGKLFRILTDILPLDVAKNPSAFQGAREVLRRATEDQPTVMDPFCGGGSTLLEAQRLGLRTIGSDLNPIPVLITTVLTRYPCLFADVVPVNPDSRRKGHMGSQNGRSIVDDVWYYAGLVCKRAREELDAFYPMVQVRVAGVTQNATVMSWIWTRTAECPNPGCRAIAPLASSFELTRANRKGEGAHWIQPVIHRSPSGPKVEYTLSGGTGKPPKPPKAGRGATFEYVACGATIDEKYVRAFAKEKGLGFEVMAGVVRLANGKREYLPATPEVRASVRSPNPEWVPDLELSTHPQYMGAPRYGMRTVADLFTPRQLTAVGVFARKVREIRADIEREAKGTLGDRAPSYATAVVTVLALCVGKFSQSHNVLVRWKIDSRNGSGKPLPSFDTQTVPAVWDFAENNPFGGSVGDWAATVVPTALRAFDYCVPDAIPTEVYQADARSAWELGSGPLVVATDPPYYDNVPYADLSDVFYPLLRFVLHDLHPDLFKTVRAPRSTELVADYYRCGGSRVKAQAYFLDGFRSVFASLAKRLRADTPMTVVYSFKQQETSGGRGIASTGWEVLLRALLEAGFAVTATWPIRTTLENRSRDIDSNALASAILIVCRLRPIAAAIATRREFLAELDKELPTAIRHLQASNIAPVDLQQAMIGPGMAVFSSYSRVLDASGEALTVREALAIINAASDVILATQEGDFDSDTRWAVTWSEQFGYAEAEYGVAETLATARNTSVSGMVDAGIVASRGGRVRLLKPAELPADWDPTTDSRLTTWEIVHHLIRALEHGGEAEAAHIVSRLAGASVPARELSYRLYSVCERKKRAAEALSYNALVQSWPEITRLAREGGATRREAIDLFGNIKE